MDRSETFCFFRHGLDVFSSNFVELGHSHKQGDRAFGALSVHRDMISRVTLSAR
jgi:hypothetical protein